MLAMLMKHMGLLEHEHGVGLLRQAMCQRSGWQGTAV